MANSSRLASPFLVLVTKTLSHVALGTKHLVGVHVCVHVCDFTCIGEQIRLCLLVYTGACMHARVRAKPFVSGCLNHPRPKAPPSPRTYPRLYTPEDKGLREFGQDFGV